MNASARKGRIRIEGVEKRFRTAQGTESVALAEVNLEVSEGELICLVGPSGCGKSTLVHLMAGFERPTRGSILIDGRPVTGPDPDRILIFQEYGLFRWKTVLGNVLFGLQARRVPPGEARERAMETLRRVGLQDAADLHPHELSGGMQQRVAIARALVVEPDVLFMDEPFAALDAFTRMQLQDELLRIRDPNRKTIVFVTHDLDEAIYLGDRVALMASGPGRIRQVLPVDLPRPRERTGTDFSRIRRELFEAFHLVHRETTRMPEYAI